ncbi:enoyl-CoA hydratase [Streptomyces sp. NPDC048370]|uniref:enoyl-CoA hydratase n=1 Tax=Streptomyces sp. NPDC048370 TaxID=3365540 RepID=UPI0037108943
MSTTPETSVRNERDGPIRTVILSRPDVRNAVDGPTATQLTDSFREFEKGEEASVADLWGEGGTFCAGAGHKAVCTDRGNQVLAEGDGPMGPTRLLLTKPATAAEAHGIGLVNRLVPTGEAHRTAERLAHKFAGFPQLCLRHDRLSVREQHGLSEPEALAAEYRHGLVPHTAGETQTQADRFAAGAGRHGSVRRLTAAGGSRAGR